MKDTDFVFMGGRCETWSWWKEMSAFMSTHVFICENNHESEGNAFCKDFKFSLPDDGCPVCSGRIVTVKESRKKL
jgi:hypothetical protein